MRRFCSGLFALLVLCMLSPVWGGDAVGGDGPQNNAFAVAPQTRFDGSVRIGTNRGAPRELHVVMQKWTIHGKQKIERFPETGFMIVHLHSGKVTTVIDGREKGQTGGAFWTVPEGSTMSVRVTSESALLEITKVERN